MINVHSNLSAAVDGRCSVSGKHSFRFFLFRNKLVMLPGNFVQWRMDRNMTLINGSYWNFRLVVVVWMVPRHRLSRSNIVRNQGHFEPANNYQRYNVLHSGTIVYQENSIWQRSRLDLQRSVFRTMAYTIWAPQIFYLMKRKRKEDLQVNLWDFSRQSDDMMSEFWFAFIKFSRQDDWICIQRLSYFYSLKGPEN